MVYPGNIKCAFRCRPSDLEKYQALAKVKNTKVSKMLREYMDHQVAENKEAINEYLKKQGE